MTNTSKSLTTAVLLLTIVSPALAQSRLPACPSSFVKAWDSWDRANEQAMPKPKQTCLMKATKTGIVYRCNKDGCGRE